MLQELNKYLKWVIIILLISVAVVSIYYRYDDCSTCKFEHEGKNVGAAKFLGIYSERCFVIDLSPKLNASMVNKSNS